MEHSIHSLDLLLDVAGRSLDAAAGSNSLAILANTLREPDVHPPVVVVNVTR
jgi:hypothetical protein